MQFCSPGYKLLHNKETNISVFLCVLFSSYDTHGRINTPSYLTNNFASFIYTHMIEESIVCNVNVAFMTSIMNC